MSLDRGSHAQPYRDAIIDDRVDQRCREALMLRRHLVGQDDHTGGERHIHSPAGDDARDKRLSPVGLVDRHGGQKNDPRHECRQTDEHDEPGLDLADDQSRDDGGNTSRNGRWDRLGGVQQDRLMSQCPQKLPGKEG